MGGARPLLVLSTILMLIIITSSLNMFAAASLPLESASAGFGRAQFLLHRHSATFTKLDWSHLESLQMSHQGARNGNRRLLQRSSATPITTPPADTSNPDAGTKHPVPPAVARKR